MSTKASKAKAVKAQPAKKTPKAPAKKKAAKVTATDQVLKIIKRSKKGVDTATLIKKTGFDQKRSETFFNGPSIREKSKELAKEFMSVRN